MHHGSLKLNGTTMTVPTAVTMSSSSIVKIVSAPEQSTPAEGVAA